MKAVLGERQYKGAVGSQSRQVLNVLQVGPINQGRLLRGGGFLLCFQGEKPIKVRAKVKNFEGCCVLGK